MVWLPSPTNINLTILAFESTDASNVPIWQTWPSSILVSKMLTQILPVTNYKEKKNWKIKGANIIGDWLVLIVYHSTHMFYPPPFPNQQIFLVVLNLSFLDHPA